MGLSYKLCKSLRTWGAPQVLNDFFITLKTQFNYGQLTTTHRCFFKAT